MRCACVCVSHVTTASMCKHWRFLADFIPFFVFPNLYLSLFLSLSFRLYIAVYTYIEIASNRLIFTFQYPNHFLLTSFFSFCWVDTTTSHCSSQSYQFTVNGIHTAHTNTLPTILFLSPLLIATIFATRTQCNESRCLWDSVCMWLSVSVKSKHTQGANFGLVLFSDWNRLSHFHARMRGKTLVSFLLTQQPKQWQQ